jgi:two-component system OmpR family sensor kinase
MSRIPIRARLTLAFALAMAVVLAAIGAFLYLRLESSLDEAINESLQADAAQVQAQVERGSAVGPIGDPDDRFAQVLDESGRVVASAGDAQLGTTPLLDPSAVSTVLAAGSATTELGEVAGLAGDARILAVPVRTDDASLVVLAGASLEDRDETVRGFLTELFVVAPIALLLASLLGYGLATLALRPVESMRREAEAISAAEPGRRLPVPESRDEISRLGETLNEMLGRLESALERERSFVADAGHELRTPLALLKTELELALRRPRTEAELAQAVSSAAEEAERLSQLAEDLLLLARSDRSQLPLDREPLRVADLLGTVAARFEGRAQEASRTIEVEDPGAVEVSADRLRVEQALGNLVANALGHGDGTVRLAAEVRNGRVELHVRDVGAGFPPDFLPNAFDRFTRADGARSGAGTGLGLAIAEAVAAAHGGSAHAANRDGGGGDVWLSFPAR